MDDTRYTGNQFGDVVLAVCMAVVIWVIYIIVVAGAVLLFDIATGI